MLLKNLLITTLWLLLPMTVFASGRLCGSSSGVVENWKGEYIVSAEDELIYTPDEPEELISTPEFDGGDDLIVVEPDLIVDEIEDEE